jgi:hypothetical protein
MPVLTMPYPIEQVSLELDTPVSYKTWLHTTRDYHLIGVIAFFAPTSYRQGKWDDLEYVRRRTDEFSVVGFPEFLSAMIIDVSGLSFVMDGDAPIFPWRMIEDNSPVRLLVHHDHRAHYSSVFEPAWLEWDLEVAIRDIRNLLDSRIH